MNSVEFPAFLKLEDMGGTGAVSIEVTTKYFQILVEDIVLHI